MTAQGPVAHFSDVHVPHAAMAAAALAVLTCSVILYRARHFTFVYDEWDFILNAKRWQLVDFFLPHNLHWSTIPQVVYRLLVPTVGIRSYLPYEAALMVVHAATAFLLFLLIRRRAGDVAALLAAALLLVLGRGFENIIWAFQVGFVGSVATGLLALWLLDTPAAGWGRQATASAALLASLMFSGMAPVFLVLVAVDLALDPLRRHALVVLIVPATAGMVWYLTLGKVGVTGNQWHLPLRDLGVLIEYVPHGIGAAVAGLFGLSSHWSALALTGLAVVVVITAMRAPAINRRLIALVVTLVAMYVLLGYERGEIGIEQAASPRYIYVGAVLVLLVLAEVVGRLPWNRVWVSAIVLVSLAGGAYSVVVLDRQYANRNYLTSQEVIHLQTMTDLCAAPDLPANALFDPAALPFTNAGQYCEGIKSAGTPVPTRPLGEVQLSDPAASDETLRRLFSNAVRIDPGAAAPARATCAVVGARRVLVAVSGDTIELRSPLAGARLGVSLSSALPPPGDPASVLTLPAGTSMLRLPDVGQPIRWQVALSEAEAPQVMACT
jgi:hypothetical protein